MKRLRSLLSVAVLCASPALAALDFTVQHKTLPADGLSLDQIYITDGASKIFLRISPAWQVFNNSQSLECVPDTPNSKVRLERFGGAKLLTIDPAGGVDLGRIAAGQVPGDAKNVAALPVELNPLPLFGWETMEAAFRYDYFGASMRRSTTYVSMIPGRVVQLTVTAPDAEFDKVHKQAFQLLSSWFEPSRDLPPDLRDKYGSPAALGN